MLDGAKVQQAREGRGWTRKEMAGKLRVSFRSLQRWELEGTQPGWPAHRLIAEVLGVEPEALEPENALAG